MNTQSVSRQLVDQRIRNRLIEYLEVLANYENDPPPWNLNETINQWEDWVHSPATKEQFSSPIYTKFESELLVEVDCAWSVFANATLSTIQNDDIQRPEWAAFIVSARRALGCLMHRGRLSEVHEV
ncbi:MAG: hypothetical protein Q8N13_19185 [Acidovorax sp.]|nr:hypothetical protein [Acidovorax sp.]